MRETARKSGSLALSFRGVRREDKKSSRRSAERFRAIVGHG